MSGGTSTPGQEGGSPGPAGGDPGFPAPYAPEAGDLIWTDFDPRTGREQGGRRPAVVLSARLFWEVSRLCIVCPVTSKVRPFPTSIVLPPDFPLQGEVLTSHVRSIDTLARPVRFSGHRLPDALLTDLRARLVALIGWT